MKSHGDSQSSLATAIGVTQSAISRYVTGRIPPAEVLLSLAKRYGTTVEAMMGSATPEKSVSIDEPENLLGRLKEIKLRFPSIYQGLRAFIETITDQTDGGTRETTLKNSPYSKTKRNSQFPPV